MFDPLACLGFMLIVWIVKDDLSDKFFLICPLFHLSIGGSVVEFSPATRETGVRFPANARFFLF